MHKKQPNIIIINPDQWRREKVKNNTRIENRIFITIILPPTTRDVERLITCYLKKNDTKNCNNNNKNN